MDTTSFMETAPIKAIVIDDEEHARRLLPLLVDWFSIGYEFVGEAADGFEALDLMETAKPDVVFVDISMPYMDGLELSRRVNERYPLTKIVIITAHQEFEYAKRSVKLGVYDFLLKPLQPETVAKLARDLKGRILEEAAHWNEYRRMKEQLAESAEYLREQFLNELVAGPAESGRIEPKYRYFFGAGTGFTGLAVLEAQSGDQGGEEDRLLLGMKCYLFLKAFLSGNPAITLFRDHCGRLVLLSQSPETELSLVGDRCIKSVYDKLGIEVAGGLGGELSALSGVSACYRQALEALRYGKMLGGGHMASYDEDILFADGTWELPAVALEEIVFFTKAGAREQVAQAIERLFAELSLSRGATIERAQAVAAHLITMLTGALSSIGLTHLKQEWSGIPIFGRVFQSASVLELQSILLELAGEASELIRSTRTAKKERMIDKVREYVDGGFRDPNLSLSSVSHKFGYNASYLSRVFKQESGQSFTDYLLKLRIDSAARMMDETDLKAYRVAEKVGIKDPYYFSYCFKKVLGISVHEYRKRG